MAVFLHCHLCGRKQADGLLSRNYWGHVEFRVGAVLRACPTCKEADADWDLKLRAALNGDAAAHDRSPTTS